MEAPKAPSQQDANDVINTTPAAEPITDTDAAKISGGVMGGDDDLEDLEVERRR